MSVFVSVPATLIAMLLRRRSLVSLRRRSLWTRLRRRPVFDTLLRHWTSFHTLLRLRHWTSFHADLRLGLRAVLHPRLRLRTIFHA